MIIKCKYCGQKYTTWFSTTVKDMMVKCPNNFMGRQTNLKDYGVE